MTEVDYFKNLGRLLRRVISVEAVGFGEDPRKVVERASAMGAPAPSSTFGPLETWDSTWVVFDRDDHDEQRLNYAFDHAARQGIEVAFSNPCFELWLLLHFQEQTASEHRHVIQTAVGGHLAGFKKKLDDSMLAALEQRSSTAARRADELQRAAERDGDPRKSPTTGVHRLVAFLREPTKKPGGI